MILVLLSVVLVASAAVLLLRRRGSGRRRLARLPQPAARSDSRNPGQPQPAAWSDSRNPGQPQPAAWSDSRNPGLLQPAASSSDRNPGLSQRAAQSGGRDPRLLLDVLAGLGAVLFVGKWWAVPVGIAVGVGVDQFLRRREPAEVRAARLRITADLALSADLLAAVLRAGAPVDRALSAVADALGGPLGERLDRIGRSLRLGAEPQEAWAHLSDVAGAERMVAAAVRSSASGGALSGAFSRLAADLRADRSLAAEAAARRAGVLIVLPLGLCFLPAFLLAGLVPVVVAVIGDVL